MLRYLESDSVRILAAYAKPEYRFMKTAFWDGLILLMAWLPYTAFCTE
ncbi:hypothetical protein QEO94_03460 [Kingella negevensis]|nr:hypothetical protein [Kingella negevensis]WII93871.1 hypothetical protein QEO94_03460 [Kingella negevensis]